MLKMEAEARQVLERCKNQHPQTKEEVRAVLLARKLENLIQYRDQLKRHESVALSLLQRVDYSHIRPRLTFVSPKDRPLWVYLRQCMSSAPWQDRPGRALYLFCIDTNSGGILGIVDLGSDLNRLGPRDRFIGWNHKRKMTGGGLRHLVNLGTCVAAQPFGWLTGGKFMSVAATSLSIATLWEQRYGDKLAGVTTTSLYGKSSQYNRLNEYLYLGNTNGGGDAHITNQEMKLLKQFLNVNNFQTKRGQQSTQGGAGGGYGNRLNYLTHACHLLNIDFNDVKGNQPRGVYFAPLGDETIYPFLRGEIDDFEPIQRDPETVSDWWLERWYAMRWSKMRDAIQEFEYRQYSVDAQIEYCSHHADT